MKARKDIFKTNWLKVSFACMLAGLFIAGQVALAGCTDNCSAYAGFIAGGADQDGMPAYITTFNAADCDPDHYEDGTNGIVVTPCNQASVYGGAGSCTLSPDGVVSYHINSGTCEIEEVDYGIGSKYYTIKVTSEDKAGSVTFTADAGGDCFNGGSVYAHRDITIGFDPGGCSGSCSPGSSGSGSFGSGNGQNDSVNFSVALGLGKEGGNAGYVQLYAERPSTNLAQPASLILTFPRLDVAVITNSTGTISQVKAPQGLITISNLDGFSYKLHCIDGTNVTGFSGGAYTYTFIPLVTWLIQNPDGAASSNRVWIAEILSGVTNRIFKYTYTNSGWSLLQPDGTTRIETSQSGSSGITNKTKNTYYGSQLVASETTAFQSVAGLSHTLLLQKTIGIGSEAQSTVYTYYSSDPANGSSTNRLRRIDFPDGRWSYFVYDDYGNLATNYESYLDNPAPAANTAPNPASIGCKITSYAYDGAGSINPWAPRETTVQLPTFDGSSWQYTTVSDKAHSYDYYSGDSYGNNLLVEQITQNATVNPVKRQVQTYVLDINYYGGDTTTVVNQYRYGRKRSESHPDGTVTIYDYYHNADGTLIVSNRTGVIGGSGTWSVPGDIGNIVDGVETVELRDGVGRTLSKVSRDIVSGLTVSSIVRNYISPNISGRDYQEINLGQLTNTYTYDCCNLATTANPDGVVTGYGYDLLKRLTSKAVYYSGGLAIISSSVLDGAGRMAVSQRTGTNGSVMTLSQQSYDSLGRVIRQTNALNGITATSYSPTNVAASVTNTYPDGGIRIEQFYLDGRLKSVTGTAIHPVRYEYGVTNDVNGNTCTFTTEIKLKNDGSDSSEWTKTYSDMAGRTTEILYADGHYSQSFYNDQNQLIKQVDPDGVTMLYQYEGKGSRAFTAVSMAGSSATDVDWYHDRITWRTNDVIYDSTHGVAVKRFQTYAWTQDGINSASLLSVSVLSSDGLQSWQVKYGEESLGRPVTNSTVTAYSGSTRISTTTAPDGSQTINTNSYGRLVSSVRKDSTGGQIGGTTYTYDAHGRQYQVADARNGTTTYGYNSADQVESVTTPSPGAGFSPEVTATSYDMMLRATNVIQPDGNSVYSLYLLTGELGKQYGSRTYPVGYDYDYAGRMKTMTNWTTYPSTGARVTTWKYDGNRGWLTNKLYDDGHGPSYTYTPAGRLQQRNWVRGVTTDYAYDNAGSLTNILYSDNTPSVTNAYDRLGRLTQQSTKDFQINSVYNLANQLLSESFIGGVLNGLSVTNGYDQFLRHTNVTAKGGSVLGRTAYGYDNASRLSLVNDGGSDTMAYTYLANSPLVSQIAFTNGSTLRMTTSKSYDYLNRLTQINSAPSSGVPATFNYTYNDANQRTKDVLADGSYWIYQYDNLGQVTNGVKHFSDGTLVPGQQFGYQFDDIGNRKQTTAGGDAAGANLRLASYTVNSLNQITNRDYPGTNDVIGVALATNSVVVNDQTAWRKGEYFWATIKSNNTVGAQLEGIKVASGGVTNFGNLYVPKTPEQFGYDADGNLTNDGHWAYVWDAENRLIAMTNTTGVGPEYGLTFGYDAKSRRIQKTMTTNGIAISTNKFLYDGWNLVAELKPDNTPLRTYVWGTDLSGSQQGAGGVSGLLEVSYYGSSTTNCFPAFDGNGNILSLVSGSDGTVAASYDYGSFGEPVRISGVMARNNPFRFSTKYADDESDLFYYGYRHYKPSTGTWLNRDPLNALPSRMDRFKLLSSCGQQLQQAWDLADSFGRLEYCLVLNSTTAGYDLLGLCVPLPDSGSGTFNDNTLNHNLGNDPIGSSLTFQICCPFFYPHLVEWGLSSSVPPPPISPHKNTFPSSFVTLAAPTGDGPCYTITVEVTTTATIGSYYGSAFIPSIRVKGSCCACQEQGEISRHDPPPLPPGGIIENPGNPIVPVF